MSAALDLTLARVFGVELETSAALPPDDAAPGEVLRAAESIGQAIADRGGRARPAVEPAWAALPVRPDVPSPRERSAAIERQLAWARAAGASWDGIDFQVDASGDASVVARRSLSSGEAILTVPRSLMIVDDELAASATGELALGWPEPDPPDRLAAWLPLEAREPASRWRAYLDALPVPLAELPMFRDEHDLAALAGTAAYAIAAEKNRDVHAAYGRLSPDLRARLSLADFAWGHALVMSRGFHAPGSLEHRVALIPLVEMFNHRLGDTTWSYDPLDGFVVRTERAFAAGDEVHFPYGVRSNTHLVVQFGFALHGNPAEEAGLLFDRAADPANAMAAHLLWKLPLDAPARLRVGCRIDDRFQRALSLARLQAAGPVERARAVEAGLTPYGDLPWLGGAIEDAALAGMAAAARRALAALDAHAPRAAHRPWDRIGSLVRDAERAVLDRILAFTTMARDELHGDDPARWRAAAAAIPDDAIGARGLVRQYLQAIAGE